jgi:hypothetical protein
MISPVNAPPSEMQITQSPELAKLSRAYTEQAQHKSLAPKVIVSPGLAATPNLKKTAKSSLKIAQAFPIPSTVVPVAEATEKAAPAGSETQYPKARMEESPLVSPKGMPKSEQSTPDTQPLLPDVKPESKEQQKPEQVMPESKPQPLLPDVKPESKEQQKPEQVMPESKPQPLVPDVKPESNPQPLAPDVKPESKEQQKPEQVMPGSQPEQLPPQDQPQPLAPDSKELQQSPPPLTPPSEVIPPQQQQNPLPSGPPTTEPANYPNNTGPGAAYYNQNYIAPSVSFGKDTLIGAASRFGLGRNLSIRPSLFLGNTTRIAVPLTYDFGFNENESFEKNPLVVFHAGGGLDYSSNGGSNKLSPLVVFGADVYLGDGASVLLQLGNTFNSDFVAVAGVGLQF